MANGRTGTVFIEDFDIGMAESFGSELVQIELDGEFAQVYALRVPGVTGPDQYKGLVPVVMSDGEDAFVASSDPQIVLSRGAVTPAMNRWQPGGHEYMVPAANARTVVSSSGRKGVSHVEIKDWARPFDISYDVHLKGRLRGQADRMLKAVGKHLWAYCEIPVRDSEGDLRTYHAFVDSYDNISEISDVSERTQGHSIPVRVEAELDFLDPYVRSTSLKFEVRVGPLRARS